MQTVWNVLNLGAGIGSTTLFMLSHHGEIPPYDACIFADTGEEPAPVMRHLAWLQSLQRPRIIVGSAGRLGDDLIKGTNADGKSSKSGRFSSVPLFTSIHHEDRQGPATGCDTGRVPRQCTNEYKIEVVERVIRRELLGLKPRQRAPKGVLVRQHFGLSDDEGLRIRKVKERFAGGKRAGSRWQEPVFPLAVLGMTRDHCIAYLAPRVPHQTPRSACTFCPYRDNTGWLWLKENDPEGWARAIEVDRAIRDPKSALCVSMRSALYLHRKCIPLEMVDVEAEAREEARKRRTGQRDLFGILESDCIAGMCGV